MDIKEISDSFDIKEEKIFPPECYKNRELSWLEFNDRVLDEARDTSENPLCERLTFLNIFQSNLDEYFMVRAGLMYDQRKLDLKDDKTSMTPRRQLDAILAETTKLLKKKDKIYSSLKKQLRLNGIELLKFEELSDKEKRSLEKFFISDVFPLLSPQIVASRQPFPFLNNKEIYAVSLLKRKGDKECLGIIPCSNPVLHRLVTVDEQSGRYMLSEDLILHFTSKVFSYYQVASSSLIRIVRNADITIDDFKADISNTGKDYRKTMEKMIQTRKKLSPIKLEFTGMIDAKVVDALCTYMKIPRRHAFYSAAPLDLSFLSRICSKLKDQKELFFVPRSPQPSPDISDSFPVIPQIRRRDVLLSFPYENIRPFLRLLNEAATNPEVVSIKITLYRVAQNSQIVDALIHAAENGKDVLVMMELRARFDEENNVIHSRDLENAGCRLIYGLDEYKVHSKLCLITLQHNGNIEYISQIGTGNYNEKTARLYTDYSLITSDKNIGEEAAAVFNALSLGQPVHQTDTLLVAPECMRDKICDRIDRQIMLSQRGEKAFVGMKLNSLTDKVVIDKLIEASRAGVRITLLVRGICCLVTGVPGYTENIEVSSIVGRYLEHSRVYIFGSEGTEEVFLSSADMMTRNTTRRVEVAVPIFEQRIKDYILSDFHNLLRDNVKRRIMQDDGSYLIPPRENEVPFCAQEAFACGLNRGSDAPFGSVAKDAVEAPKAPVDIISASSGDVIEPVVLTRPSGETPIKSVPIPPIQKVAQATAEAASENLSHRQPSAVHRENDSPGNQKNSRSTVKPNAKIFLNIVRNLARNAKKSIMKK